MPFVPVLPTDFTDGQVLFAAQLDGNFAALRNNVNAYCAFVDESATISGAWTFTTEPTISSGLTVGDTLTVTTGGLVVSAGGIGVTGNSTITGTLGVSGALTAASFSGAGGSLTALNASNLDSGTVPDARFPATLPALNGSNLTNLAAANIVGLTAANVGAGSFPSGSFTFPGAVTGGGFSSTGRDRMTRTTGTASSGTYALVVTTNHHRVLINHTSSVELQWPSGTAAGEFFLIETLQSTTPQPITFAGSGITVVWSNGVQPPATLTANRKDVWGALRTSTTEILMWQVAQNMESTT